MRTLPLLVHLIFHPKSNNAMELARFVHSQLNNDAMVPGLRVPTVFCPYPEPCALLSTHPLQAAERSVVVILADDNMAIDSAWCTMVANTWEGCATSAHRCVPFQLTDNAWPLDTRLRGVNFGRAHVYSPEELNRRNAFVVRRIVIELCRYMMNLEAHKECCEAPVKLFLSHTKLDIAAPPQVARELIKYLSEDQPVEAWVDSGDIATGSEFGKAIENGVKRTSLLVVLTDQYASREWCREEVILAKEHQRPVAVIDALNKFEIRSLPFLGNVPWLRWNGDPQACVDLLLKETLRTLHAEAVLNSFRQKDDFIFTRTLELASLVNLPAGKTALYPDPPLGLGEARTLEKLKVSFTTPMHRMATTHKICRLTVALSMSESTDIERYGLDSIHLESTMLELSRYLLLAGATLGYGGNAGVASYTNKLFELVRTHNNLTGVKSFERIINFRGWPLPPLSVGDKAKNNLESRTIEFPCPAEIDPSLDLDFSSGVYFASEKSPMHRHAWARGMTAMREYQTNTKHVAARIVSGGPFGPTVQVADDGSVKKRWYAGRIPGVLEEILLSVKHGQPLFLIGAFGGAARLAIDLLENKKRDEFSWEFQKDAPHAEAMRNLYYKDDWWDYTEMMQLLCKTGIQGLNPHLTVDEHRELFRTIDPVRMVEIILKGLGGLQNKMNGISTTNPIGPKL